MDDTPETLIALARGINAKQPDPQKAIKALVRQVKDNDDLADEIVYRACAAAIYQTRHVSARMIRANACARTLEGMAAVGEAITCAILDLRMSDGRKLRDFTGDELIPLIAEEREHEAAHRHKWRLFQSLADVAGKRRIGEAVKDDAANEMWQRIKGGEALEVVKPHSLLPAAAKNGNGKAVALVKPALEVRPVPALTGA